MAEVIASVLPERLTGPTKNDMGYLVSDYVTVVSATCGEAMPVRRKIIEIDESRCDGCGKCVNACEEAALKLIDGKARLARESHCDGLGACLGECPRGAISILEREAEPFGEEAAAGEAPVPAWPQVREALDGGCPGSALLTLGRQATPGKPARDTSPVSMLNHWPVQLMLVPPHAPFLKNSDLVICADCVPFAVPDFHARYLRDRAVVVGCPKLDDLPRYREKLARMMEEARPARVTVAIMEVPCCRGLADAALRATGGDGMKYPVEQHIIGIRGGISRHVVRQGVERDRVFSP
ncbi:MAG TPA: 4Fe-4S binding protein [Anaeromyxobacteraceae bacterium]|nr:4Fe-4S binding protein [Anaeromyxobacteraceae bacterium]